MAFIKRRKWKSGKITWQVVDKEVNPVYQKSLGEVTEREARRKLQHYLRRKEDIIEGRGIPNTSLIEIIDSFLTYSAVNMSESTYELHKLSLRHIVDFFGNCPLTVITAQRIEGYKAFRLNQTVNMGRGKSKVKPRTVNIELGVLRTMLRRGKLWGLVKDIPHIQMLREVRKDIRILSIEEADRLVDACPPWLRPIVIIGLHTGMRRGEILGLKWSDIDFENREITIRISTTKTRKPRVVPMSERVYKELSQMERENDLLFPLEDGRKRNSFRDGLKWACKRAGIHPPVSSHCLRHSFTSVLLNNGGDMKVVQEMLGHKTIDTTLEIYSHLSTTRTRKLLENLPFGRPQD